MEFKLYSLESKSKLTSDEKVALLLMTNANLSARDKALDLALRSGKTLDKHLEVVTGKTLQMLCECLQQYKFGYTRFREHD